MNIIKFFAVCFIVISFSIVCISFHISFVEQANKEIRMEEAKIIKEKVNKKKVLNKQKYYEQQAINSDYILSHLKPARKKDYKAWYRGYLKKGGQPISYSKYSFQAIRKRFFIAESDFEMRTLFGARSLFIIIPKGIKVTNPNSCGHNKLYFMDGFTHNGWVTVYDDIKIEEDALWKP